MRFTTLAIVAFAAVVSLVVGAGPYAWHHWCTRTAEHGQRTRFATNHAAVMMEEYPLIMGEFVQKNAAEMAGGVASPVLMRVWDQNTVVYVVRAVSNWVATNFLVRALSPSSAYDVAGLIALLIFAGIVVLAGGNLISNVVFANTFRHNSKKARARPASMPSLASDE